MVRPTATTTPIAAASSNACLKRGDIRHLGNVSTRISAQPSSNKWHSSQHRSSVRQFPIAKITQRAA
jgi:hypothetical protein